jgi:hypothetical protein
VLTIGAGLIPLAVSVSSATLAAAIPLILLSLAFVGYCLFDIYRSAVRYLPKWAWVLICLASVPFGGIVYLIMGREDR